MATLAQIYNWFMTGKKPTQDQFWESWGSFWNKSEPIPQNAISNLIPNLNAKAEKAQFDAHKTDVNAHSDLLLKARGIPIGKVLFFKVGTNANQSEKEPGDYCMGIVEGSFVSGNWTGGNDQLKSSYT